jgi:hypothetical protein
MGSCGCMTCLITLPPPHRGRPQLHTGIPTPPALRDTSSMWDSCIPDLPGSLLDPSTVWECQITASPESLPLKTPNPSGLAGPQIHRGLLDVCPARHQLHVRLLDHFPARIIPLRHPAPQDFPARTTGPCPTRIPTPLPLWAPAPRETAASPSFWDLYSPPGCTGHQLYRLSR